MKAILIILLILISHHIHAQNGFFAQAMAGGGVTNMTVYNLGHDLLDGYTIVSYSEELKPTQNIRFLLGWQRNNLVFKTGFSKFNNGDVFEIPKAYSEYKVAAYYYKHYNYLALPFSVGYKIKISESFSLAPTLAYTFGFVTSSQVFTNGDYGAGKTYTMNESGTNSFAALQLEMAYKLTSRFYFIATPEAQYKIPANLANSYSYFNSHSYTLNLGLKYCLGPQHSNIRTTEGHSSLTPAKK